MREHGIIDAIVPAFNEAVCIVPAVRELLRNKYFHEVIVVNDGSTDNTGPLLDLLAATHPRLKVIHQANTGKGGALMAGIAVARAPFVFLTDADTHVPADSDGMGYMLAEMARGADAVGGIPASNLVQAGILPYVRATLKLPMIAAKRTFQQLLGGAPFIISGACGLFRTEVLRAVPFSDRTKVEDLDLSWSLVAAGYRVRLCNRAIVYSQECEKFTVEWLRWRRWIVGYAICMRLHRRLLLTRFGLFTIMPMFVSVVAGSAIYGALLLHSFHDGRLAPQLALYSLLWICISFLISIVSAVHHRRWLLFALAPTSILYVMIAYIVWVVHGLRGLFTGVEPARDKPVRSAHVVG